MRIARCVGNRKLIFAMINRQSLSPTTHLNKAGNANLLTRAYEFNQEAHSKPQRKA